MTSRPRVAVLDYGIGNLRSAQKALERVGADAVLTADARVAASADAVVLPGVGAFGACMNALRTAGLESVVHDSVARGVPFMGICVGMQIIPVQVSLFFPYAQNCFQTHFAGRRYFLGHYFICLP